MDATTHLLYLHGFRSSPQAASLLIERLTAHWPTDTMAVIGSSLGGFYATWLAYHRNCKTVLLNPAVYPARDLARG